MQPALNENKKQTRRELNETLKMNKDEDWGRGHPFHTEIKWRWHIEGNVNHLYGGVSRVPPGWQRVHETYCAVRAFHFSLSRGHE